MPNAFMSDLRSAVRSLRRARGFTGVAILTLGLALTLCLTVLRIVNAYLVHTLPYPGADRLYSVRYAPAGQPEPARLEALDWHSLSDVIEHPIAWDLDMFYLLGDAAPTPEPAQGAWVTPGFVDGLGIRPAIGRGFGAEDFEAGRPNVVLIGHRLWQNRFGGDPAIVGRRFRAYVSDRPEETETFTVIGVLSPDFWHLNPYTEVLAPLRAPTYPYLVRLREGVPASAAEARITALVRASSRSPSPVPSLSPTPASSPSSAPLQSAPPSRSSAAAPVRAGVSSPGEDWPVALTPTHASYVAQVRPLLLAAGAAAGLTLAIGCANIAVLLLVRASRREKEMAVRRALGAGPAQIARLVAIEALLLAGGATMVGLAGSSVAMAWLTPLVERQLERPAPGGASAFAVDGVVLLGAIACGLFTTCVCVFAPLAASWRTSVSQALARDNRGATDGPGRRRARSALIALEVAASLALLTGAALMVDSALRMLRVDFGMRTTDVLAASVALRQRSYPDAASRADYFERLLARLPRIAGVQSTAVADWWPLQQPQLRAVEAERGAAGGAGLPVASDSPVARGAGAGRAGPARGSEGLGEGDGAGRVATRSGVLGVSPDYFATLGIPLRDGRAFTSGDRAGGEAVAIVSATLARRLWPAMRAVGQRLRVADDEAEAEAAGAGRTGAAGGVAPRAAQSSSYLVVGVADDVRQTHADDDLADVYVPLLQRAGRFGFVYLRVQGSSAHWERDLRVACADVDAEVSIGAPRLLQTAVDRERARPRFLAWLLAGVSAFAAAIALVGLYGVIAYAARQREREIAVRMALGAGRATVTRQFLGEGAAVLAVGLVAGLCAAPAIGRILESQLYGVRPFEPRVLAITTVAFATCGLLAIWRPARRAATTDPALALTSDS
jgi:putative ABC transport system permease protein